MCPVGAGKELGEAVQSKKSLDTLVLCTTSYKTQQNKIKTFRHEEVVDMLAFSKQVF